MADPTTVDEFFASLPEPKREAMETLRRTIRAAAPDADEVITYKMPGFKRNGRFLVSYDAFKTHYGLFPASDEVIRGLGDEIAPYVAGKSTIRFPASRPIPADLVTKIIRIRLAENDAVARGNRKDPPTSS
jgi:uncharacterized protein YdhG (YjbR/CyaY superfamily)